MNQVYMNKNNPLLESYYGSNCVNATNVPCWIPHIRDEIDAQNELNKCQTIMDLNCELMALYSGLDVGSKVCTKPCQSWKYVLNSRSAKLSKYRLQEVCGQMFIYLLCIIKLWAYISDLQLFKYPC